MSLYRKFLKRSDAFAVSKERLQWMDKCKRENLIQHTREDDLNMLYQITNRNKGWIVCVEATSVSQYIMDLPDDDDLKWFAMTPPFEYMWLESKRPKMVGDPSECYENYGMLLITRLCNQDGARWEVEATPFMQYQGSIYFLGYAFIVHLGNDGFLMKSRIEYSVDMQEPDNKHGTIVAGLQFLYTTLTFMNCKNIKLSDTPTSLKKGKREKNFYIKWKTLEVTPMSVKERSQGESIPTGIKQPLHICRGHFKDFREKGLFGKNKGVYFWQQSIRGSQDIGIVAKDYEVKL